MEYKKVKSFTFKGKNDIIHNVKGVVEMNKNINTLNEMSSTDKNFIKIDKTMNVLDKIKSLEKSFTEAVKSGNIIGEKNSINKVTDELNKILIENIEKEEHKNIGTKVNKFNIEKYVSANQKINNIVELVNNNKVKIGGVYNILLKNGISNLQEQINHRISTYNRGKK